MISIKRLALHNFRSFVGFHTLDFEPEGLVLLMGESGAGKSSIFLAIAYAMGFCPFSAKDLKSWGTEDAMFVDLTLSTPKGLLEIRRGIRSSFRWQDRQITGEKGISEALDEALGLAKPIREALTFRAQRQPGVFLTKSDAEKKRFLTEVLNLGWLEEEIEQSVKRVGLAQREAETIQPLLAKARTDVSGWQPLVIELIDAAGNYIITKADCYEMAGMHEAALAAAKVHEQEQELRKKKVLEEYQAKVQILEQENAKINLETVYEQESGDLHRLDSQLAECAQIQQTLELEDRAAQQKVKIEEQALQREIYVVQKQLNEVNKAKVREGDLLKLINSLESEICPECKQTWTSGLDKLEIYRSELKCISALAGTEETIQLQIQAIESMKSGIIYVRDPRLDEVVQIQLSLEQVKATEKQRLKNAEARNRAALDLLLAQNRGQKHLLELELMRSLKDIENDPEWISIKEKVQKSKEEVLRLNAALASQEATKQARLQEQNRMQQLKKRAQQYLDETEATAARYQKAAALERDYLDLLRGFLGQIFSEVLTAIATEANYAMGNIPNIAHVSLRFDVERQTQEGKMRSEITPIISYGNKEAPLLSGASGGMLSSIEMAVDLAVSKVVSQRLGASLGWCIFDEPMAGLDTVSQEAALELLKEEAKEKLILVVTHGSEMRENFSKIIQIRNENGRSVIVQ